MPFHDGVYYPYTSDTHGTHSSAGIPSLLNSPLSQPSAPGMTPSSGVSSILPFKFRPRRESVDWRRINAVDIDSVVSQLDVDALQEHVSTVTFCSLDGERCQRCQSPVDPALIKLLQLAQLTVEWLLHCQDFLSLSLRAAEERMAAAGREREELLDQMRKQEEKLKNLTAELKQRKKVIRAQQSLLTPRIISSHKCAHCDKSFLNSAFLTNHMQRRHPDELSAQLQSDKKSQIESLKLEIGALKEQIAQQQEALAAKIVQEKEQESVHKDLLRELGRMDRKIEDSRDGIRREMELLYSRNIQALNEANQNQSKQEKQASPENPPPERDVDAFRDIHLQQMKKKEKKWQSRLQEMQAQHASEKNQLQDELSSMSEKLETSQREQQGMKRRLQEQEQTIQAQGEQIKIISSILPTKVKEVPVNRSPPAAEPKPKHVVLEEPVSTLTLDPIQELSEEDKADSSLSEPEPAAERKPKAALKVGASVKRDTRLELERSVAKKLESLGVKAKLSSLKSKELTSVMSKVRAKREMTAKKMPEYWRHHEEILRIVEKKLGVRSGGRDLTAKTRSKQPVQVVKIRPRSSSLPSTARQPRTPQPAPRTRTSTQPKTSTPNPKAPRVIKSHPFSSDESEEEDMEEEDASKPPTSRSHPPTRAGRFAPVLTRQEEVGLFSKPRPRQARPAADAVTRADIEDTESEEEEEDLTEVSEVQEITLGTLQGYRDQSSKRNQKETSINEMARKIEKFAERVVKKPAGGVSVLPTRKDEVEEISLTDLEGGSDWVISKPASLHGSGPTRRSMDSPSTSVWGTSTGKGPKSDLTDAGTGSTLKSSICSVSDLSDSDDFSNKHD
ncbi:zinc finger protein Dzip1 isoform X1 [Oryzias latipes]|uniref:DAZ interacting zinc finger protein 1 n=1 Tax=Oryzias latipes TaxID=8090 RepID=H2LEU5_ORYLA|nr:zinc finger protein Dzip1 isoform X1 [Oryzias latipes]XP_023821179.1 zinc finger protein Dzip1 isoform X1 [Oryzias latipes]